METKRRNFSEGDDLLLLKQAVAVKPYKEKHGKVVAQWEGVAASLVSSAEFSRANLGGKTAQNRFNLLVDSARKKMKVAKRASGVEEAYTEKDQLLDDIIAEINDFQHAKTLAKDVAATKALANEKAGEVVRQLAVERLKRGAPDGNDTPLDSPAKPNKFAKIAQVLAEHKEQELTFRREQWKVEREDRLEAERLRRQETDRF
ncbi:hypothetical protein PF008_g14458, partial [Phytophthora fragariae]